MICADAVSASGVPATWQASAVQPADYSTCDAVMLQGTDVSALAIFTFPAAADMGEAFSIAFVGVMTCYLAGVAVGTVVNSWRKW